MIICGQEFSDDIIRRIETTAESNPTMSRLALSRLVCEWLGWRRENGQWKDMSCRVALLKLHRLGKLHLPPAAIRPAPRSVVGNDFVSGKHIQCGLSDLGPIELVKISGRGSRVSRLWNEMMNRHHYLKAGPLCGAQMRYLIQDTQGRYVGGLAFSAAAWSLDARDLWIGWSSEARQRNLNKVVCNSRFLILPWVRVPCLASHALSLCSKRLVEDWRERYGVEPVLMETFVEQKRFKGTCYRAANWTHVGVSCGRGRQDKAMTFPVEVKNVYVYPLNPKARALLCEEPLPAIRDRRSESEDWAEEEFGLTVFNNKRLETRLLTMARDFYERPQAHIPQACQSRAKTKAAYRFFDHPETTMDKILASHYEATLNRINQENVVLVVQDTTSLNYTAHPATRDLGPINKVKGALGLEMHDTMAFNVEGTPLGLVDVQCWARDPKEFGQNHQRHKRSIEQKESNKWLVSFKKTGQAQKRCPKTMLVSVGDREADIHDLFHLALKDGAGPKLLVRAMQDRLLAEGEGHLWDVMAQKLLAGIQVIGVPRQGQRAARQAHLEVRFGQVTLRPPQLKRRLGEVRIWAVLAEEKNAPPGVEPLQWLLLTTMEVVTYEQAIEKLHWYTKRWGIEVYHRTLKSGCQIEQRQLGTADRIETCLAIDLVVAWRIFHLTKLGRETPDVPCTVYFEEAEWKALCCFMKQDPHPPTFPPTLRDAIRMVASLGGFLGRKSDGEPGTQTLWLGIQRLDDIAATWKFTVQHLAPHFLTPVVSSNLDYG